MYTNHGQPFNQTILTPQSTPKSCLIYYGVIPTDIDNFKQNRESKYQFQYHALISAKTI
ncbi:4430_t:CDS:2 [Racocetra fulgida]|uniref:4430_t:CDS:1 n=1 Tax=Racocetra fulgida TaxID=60492 RepID=A0A9N8VDT7_9GLOM|nr:4430_t:CDS:2 [Racocetra fulgida]